MSYSALETAEEAPRIRPSLGVFMVMAGGLGLLKLGHDGEWFLGALESGTLHNLTYLLAWGIVGAAYSLLASFLWIRWRPQGSRVRRNLALLLLLGLMTAGSQTVALRVMRTLSVHVVGVDWDPDSQEFVVEVASTRQAVADARRRGDLQTIVTVEGLWWSPSDTKPSQQLLASEVEEFAVGAPDLLRYRHRGKLLSYSGPSNQQDLRWVRLSWKPSSVKSDWAYFVAVKTALVNRKGKRVGCETTYGGGSATLSGGWGPPNAFGSRVDMFFRAAWDWNHQSGRPRAPFRVAPPPP